MWEELVSFNLTNEWQLSNLITSSVFKISHVVDNYLNQNQIAQIALINDNVNPIEIFELKRISARPEAEIVKFSSLSGWSYKLGLRQILLPGKQPIDWTIHVQTANFETQNKENMTNISNNIIFGNGQSQELPQQIESIYKHWIALDNVQSENDGEWIDAINFSRYTGELVGIVEPIDYNEETYSIISIYVSNLLEKPGNSYHGYEHTQIMSNQWLSGLLDCKWFKIRVRRYKEGDSITCRLLFK